MLPSIAAAAVLGSQAFAANADGTGDPLLDFVVGDYVIVGREPDAGAAYAGSARISRSADGVALERNQDGHSSTAVGSLEVASPPGDGHVLRFQWQEPAPTTMTCLIASDLDNYARLTCYWLRDGSEPRQPGLEAMFPTAAWPDKSGSR
jgi:hypothetical protein